MNDVIFVHGEWMVQFRPISNKKLSSSGDKSRTKGSSMYARADKTMLSTSNSNAKSTNKGVVCSNTHGLSVCDAFKKLTPNDWYKKVKKVKLCFLCFRGAHAVKDCKMRECRNDGCKKHHNTLLLHPPENTKGLLTKSAQTVETHAIVCLQSFGNLPVYEVENSNNGKTMKVQTSHQQINWFYNAWNKVW